MRTTIFVTGLIILARVAACQAIAAPIKPTKTVDQRDFNALMNRLYPSGKGPASTSSARGFYKGNNGIWRRR